MDEMEHAHWVEIVNRLNEAHEAVSRGPWKSRERSLVLTKIEEALMWAQKVAHTEPFVPVEAPTPSA